MKNKIKNLSFFPLVFGGILVSVFFLNFGLTYGATTVAPTQVKTETIAKTSVKNLVAKFDEKTRKIKVDFDLIDTFANQSDVSYNLTLISVSGIEKTFTYSDNVYLNVGQTVHKILEEIVPDYLSGKTDVFVKVQNKSGIMLAMGFLLKNVDIPKVAQSVSIVNDSCYLTVDSTSTTKKNIIYTLLQGVDLNLNEGLVLNCKVLNTFSKSVNLTPEFVSYERTVGGNIVDSKKLDGIEIISGAPVIKVKVPLVIKPQAYDSVFSLKDSSGVIPSTNNIIFHYVIRGDSGTVGMINTDKSSYLKGETANIDVMWSSRADYFPNSRFDWEKAVSTGAKLTGSLVVNDLSGELCADPVSFSPSADKDETFHLQAVMNKDCNGFTTKIDVKQTDQKTGQVSGLVDSTFNTPKTDNGGKMNNLLIMIFAIFVLIVIGIIVLLKNRSAKLVSILVLVMLGSMFVSSSARADSFHIPLGEGFTIVNADFTIKSVSGTETSTFNVGDTMVVDESKTANYQRCSNGAYAYVSSKLKVVNDTTGVTVYSESDYNSVCDATVGGSCLKQRNIALITAGNYTVTDEFFGHDSADNTSATYTMTKSVVVGDTIPTSQPGEDADIGLRVNQGTTSSPDVVVIAVEKNNGATSPLRIAKDGVIHGVKLVDASDAFASKIKILVSPSTVKFLKKYDATPVFVPSGSQMFINPGTFSFTVPTGVTSLNVKVWGAGGGGAKYATKGTDGEDSSFGNSVSATGGKGGNEAVGTYKFSGNPDYMCTGNLIYGGNGGTGTGSTTVTGYVGKDSMLGAWCEGCYSTWLANINISRVSVYGNGGDGQNDKCQDDGDLGTLYGVGSGGGAGGYAESQKIVVPGTVHTVIVGAGGANAGNGAVIVSW